MSEPDLAVVSALREFRRRVDFLLQGVSRDYLYFSDSRPVAEGLAG